MVIAIKKIKEIPNGFYSSRFSQHYIQNSFNITVGRFAGIQQLHCSGTRSGVGLHVLLLEQGLMIAKAMALPRTAMATRM